MKPSCKLFRNLGTFYLSQLLWMNNVLISPYHVTHSKYRQRKMHEPNNEQTRCLHFGRATPKLDYHLN